MVSMLHATNESRFALVDVPATFCVTLFLCLTARGTHLTFRTCLWLGIIVGISLAVKFPTVFVAMSLVIFIHTENFYKKFSTIVGVAGITFTLICPYWLIDLVSPVWNNFFEDFWYEANHYHRGHFGLFATGDTSWINRFLSLWTLLKWGMGFPLALLVSIGCLFSLAKLVLSFRIPDTINLFTDINQRGGLLLLAFVLPYLLFIGSFKVSFTRHLLILYPAFTVLAALWLVTRRKWIGAVIGSAVMLYSSVYTLAFASVLITQPTIQEVSQWVSTNISHNNAISRSPEILFDWLIPELDRDMVHWDEEAEWVLIIQPNWEVFQRYNLNPDKYEERDWYPLENIEIEGPLDFYNEILGENSSYKLSKTFKRNPEFFGIRIDDKSAPFPMRALLHPEIHLYRRSQ